MDSQKYLIYIYSLILFIFPNTMNTQRITCPRACDVGYTCAMVRHGNEPPRAGCINMEEAIMLHQALNGGPTGPESGRRIQTDTGLSQPNVGRSFPQSPRPGDPIPPFPPSPIPGESIPGMNFLGGTGAQQQGFEQRFEQGIGRQPQTFMNPTNMLGPQGMSSMGGPISGQFGNPQGQAGMAGPRFLDPTAGQFGPSAGQFGLGAEQFGPSTGQFGPSAGQFAPTAGQFGPATGQFGPAAGQFGPVGAGTGRPPVGFGPQVDGGHSHTSSASGNRDNTNIDRLGSSHGGGNLRRNNDIQGEQLNSDFNINPPFNSIPITENNLDNIPDGFIGTDTFANNQPITAVPEQGPVDILGSPQAIPPGKHVEFNAQQTNVDNAPMSVDLNRINAAPLETQHVERSQVTSIREDSSGLHYLFFPRAGKAGFRVDITRDGFCPRDDLTRDNNCMNMCHTDEQCDLDQKCCPTGCSLTCRNPSIPVRESMSQP